MSDELSEREQGFNDGIAAAIGYFTGMSEAASKIDGSAAPLRAGLMIMIGAYQADLRAMRKRADAEIQADFDANARPST